VVSTLRAISAGVSAIPDFAPASGPDLTLQMSFDMAVIMVKSPFVPECTRYGMNRHRQSSAQRWVT
jgi:hypothetical protein